MPDRKFRIRYGTWSPREAVVPAEKIGDDNGLEAVRLAMGHAFMEQLKGRWDDNADLQVVLDKSSPGLWSGRRVRPETKKKDPATKDEPFYIMEI